VTPSAGLRSLVPPRGGRCPQAAVGLLRKVDELHVAKAEKCPWHAASKRWPRKWFFLESSYLVDPASSHMLVSKIKPCMSKYKQVCTVKLRMAH
jgi:hypothetical protein